MLLDYDIFDADGKYVRRIQTTDLGYTIAMNVPTGGGARPHVDGVDLAASDPSDPTSTA